MQKRTLNTSALRDYRLFDSHDLDETQNQISQIMQPHVLSPKGQARGRSHMDFVRLGGVGIGTIAFGDAMSVEVEALHGYWLLMFCVSGQASVQMQGSPVSVDSTSGVLCAPGQRFDAVLSKDCEQLILRIDPVLLKGQTGLATPRLEPVVAVGGTRLGGWLQQLKLVAESRELLACAQANPAVAAQLGQLLLELLIAGHDRTNPASGGMHVQPGFIRRACEFMHAHWNTPLELAGIAAAAEVSERTLLSAFRQFRGTSPMQYLRELRLAEAHRALKGTTCHASVAEIALDCGFTHLGRFAGAYRKRFGELPSETARAAGNLD